MALPRSRRESTLNPAEAIANAIRQNTPIGHAGEMVAVAIPNHLDETGQDDLISAFQALGIFNVRLLWRPIALAMSWASRNPDRAKALVDSGGSLWVMDLESYGLELTELKWRLHSREPNYACPVRSYPRRNDFDPDWASRHWAAKIAGDVCGQSGRSTSLLWGPAGADFQRFLEGERHGPLVFQDKEDPRRWSLGEPVHFQLHQDVVALADAMGRLVPGMQPHDRILVHGWPAAHIGEHLARQLHRRIDVAGKYAVAEGAALYAQRDVKTRPTYYDTLPQYAIWVSRRDKNNQLNFLWKALNDESVVDAGEKWVLSSRTEPDLIRLREDTLRLPQYVDKFSLLVQNKTVYDADTLNNHEASVILAKRLVVDLPTMTTAQTPLRLEMVLRPASGHARFSISARDDQPLFLDRYSVDLSWKTAQDEPEHKGYLEAREVVGRIMDRPGNRELARLLARRVRGEIFGPEVMHRFQILMDEYRPGHIDVDAVPVTSLLARVLTPWGHVANPAMTQPTRGLWGSRRQFNDPELDEIAEDMGEALLHMGGGGDWYKWLNQMFVYTPRAFIDQLRDELSPGQGTGHIHTWNLIIAPGRVFDNPDDFQNFIRFSLECGFTGPDNTYTQHYWWSFFRCLCYHKATAKVAPELVYQYLEVLCEFIEQHDLPPNTFNDQRRKYALHALLFALRLRDNDKNLEFMPLNDPLVSKYNHLFDAGRLSDERFPPSMLAGMGNMVQPGDNFSKYVRRFLNFEDTLADREMGAGLATS